MIIGKTAEQRRQQNLNMACKLAHKIERYKRGVPKFVLWARLLDGRLAILQRVKVIRYYDECGRWSKWRGRRIPRWLKPIYEEL